MKDFKEFLWLGVFFLVAVLGFGSWEWYKAGLQTQTYKRQGINLTQWECFVGVKPAEQVIQIRDKSESK